ncbi:TetR/AcrR family transcriptional regulator [Agromyces aerolatus]|uniref:TetR/AcrR family transcriptional regulator n=1 Tax=Agromyces sp. LY-1074 TaxID=3074080 RepID=UPI00285F223B|nr:MULTISPECIES: TetR/AcrR family transcriptional regulator C-terminal domain-containing protein [unclassified Agromyces]MDR5700995.1 TetR/AcrR family transcriptional regulator C-terminal domain-containing protein [Agromyces sp. LY-1074]MDR5707635.1 TetR/AcrR family transcriptional regulator C-terminal domain-containing protein [Agromyces sp. LY-1358]
MTPASDAPRARLDRTQVVVAAVARADQAGLDQLSMRSLAHELGVVPMALYKHVANKDELLDGMVDLVWSEVEPPRIGAPWRQGMRARTVSLREALRRHRWAIGLMEARMRPGPANLRQHNAMMGCLRESGFSFRTTVHVTTVLDAYVYGFALQEHTLPFETPAQSGEVAAQHMESVPPEAAAAFPYLVEVVTELAQAGYDHDDEFETGLELILDGIERLRPTWRTG